MTNKDISLKKRIAAGSIATLMALSGITGINKSVSAKSYAATNTDKKITREEAVNIYGDEKVTEAEQIAADTVSKENIKNEVEMEIQKRKEAISIETAKADIILNQKGNSTENELYQKYEGYIDKEAYEKNIDHLEGYIAGSIAYDPQAFEEFEKNDIEEEWTDYIYDLQHPSTTADQISILLSSKLGLFDGYRGISDPESNEIYQEYKDYLNQDIYMYCYGVANKEGKQLMKMNEDIASEQGLDLTETNKEILQLNVNSVNRQISQLEQYIATNGKERDKWELYYKGLEVGYADEYYKITNQDDRVSGINLNKKSIGNDRTVIQKYDSVYYEGYYNGSDKRDQDYLSEKAKTK